MRGRFMLTATFLLAVVAGGVAIATRDEGESSSSGRGEWTSYGPRTDAPAKQPAEVRAAPVIGCAKLRSPFVPGWRRQNSIIAGPLGFAYGEDLARQRELARPQAVELRRLLRRPDATASERRLARMTLRAAPKDGYGVSETPVVVDRGREATVVVPGAERRHVSLIYTGRAKGRERAGARGIYRVSDGDPAITFRACREHETHFNGGFVAAGARCVPLQIWVPDRSRPIRRVVSLGAGRCPTPAVKNPLSGAPARR